MNESHINFGFAPPPLIIAAYEMARAAHAGQFRRDGITPYLNHIHKVMMRANWGVPVDVAVAALHDSLEPDCVHRLTEKAILEGLVSFGDQAIEVADGVMTLTKKDNESYETFIERIKGYRNGRWMGMKINDILANLSDDPSRKQLIKYSKALLVLLS